MEKEIKKINTYIEMLEVAQQHFEAKGDTKNAEFCTIKINNAKDDIAALQAGYEVDMAEYNSLVSDVEEDVIENIEEPVYDEVNPKYEIITLEEANKKTTKKGKKIIASIGCVALTALIVAGIINMSGCHKNNTKVDNTIEPQTTDEEINEVAKVEETENVVLPVFEEVDLDALISERAEQLDLTGFNIDDEKKIRILNILNDNITYGDIQVTNQEIFEAVNLINMICTNYNIDDDNAIKGFTNVIEGNISTRKLAVTDLFVNKDSIGVQYLDKMITINEGLNSEDQTIVENAYKDLLAMDMQLTSEVQYYNQANENITIGGTSIEEFDKYNFYSLTPTEKIANVIYLRALTDLADTYVYEGKINKNLTAKIEVELTTKENDSEDVNVEIVTVEYRAKDFLDLIDNKPKDKNADVDTTSILDDAFHELYMEDLSITGRTEENKTLSLSK